VLSLASASRSAAPEVRKNRRDKVARLATSAGSNPTAGSSGESVIRNCIFALALINACIIGGAAV
jgi:hypothetical protein